MIARAASAAHQGVSAIVGSFIFFLEESRRASKSLPSAPRIGHAGPIRQLWQSSRQRSRIFSVLSNMPESLCLDGWTTDSFWRFYFRTTRNAGRRAGKHRDESDKSRSLQENFTRVRWNFTDRILWRRTRMNFALFQSCDNVVCLAVLTHPEFWTGK